MGIQKRKAKKYVPRKNKSSERMGLIAVMKEGQAYSREGMKAQK